MSHEQTVTVDQDIKTLGFSDATLMRLWGVDVETVGDLVALSEPQLAKKLKALHLKKSAETTDVMREIKDVLQRHGHALGQEAIPKQDTHRNGDHAKHATPLPAQNHEQPNTENDEEDGDEKYDENNTEEDEETQEIPPAAHPLIPIELIARRDCMRCGGNMTYIEMEDPSGLTFPAYRCVQCGDLVDPVILANRIHRPPAKRLIKSTRVVRTLT